MFDGLTFSDYQDAITLVIKTIKTSKNVNDLRRKLRSYEDVYLAMAEFQYKIAWNNNNHAAFQLYLKNDNLAWIMDCFATSLDYLDDGYEGFTFPFTMRYAKQLISTNGYGK